MFPQNPVVDLMKTDRIGNLDGIALVRHVPTVEVLYMAQTITPEAEVVGVTARAIIA